MLFLTQLPFAELNLSRLGMASYMKDGKAGDVGKIWSGGGIFWEENSWLFTCGTGLALVSVVMLGVTLGELFNLVP